MGFPWQHPPKNIGIRIPVELVNMWANLGILSGLALQQWPNLQCFWFTFPIQTTLSLLQCAGQYYCLFYVLWRKWYTAVPRRHMGVHTTKYPTSFSFVVSSVVPARLLFPGRFVGPERQGNPPFPCVFRKPALDPLPIPVKNANTTGCHGWSPHCLALVPVPAQTHACGLKPQYFAISCPWGSGRPKRKV